MAIEVIARSGLRGKASQSRERAIRTDNAIKGPFSVSVLPFGVSSVFIPDARLGSKSSNQDCAFAWLIIQRMPNLSVRSP